MEEENLEEEVPKKNNERAAEELFIIIGFLFTVFCYIYTIISILVKLLPPRF